MSAKALLDTNVLIAAVASEHEHHDRSRRLIALAPRVEFAIAAHAFAEAYNTLTRGGPRGPFRFTPGDAIGVLESIRGKTLLLGATANQTFDGVRRYAFAGGIGPRLYDKLIGDVAALNGISRIITWNVRHMRELFSTLTVEDPSEFMMRTA